METEMSAYADGDRGHVRIVANSSAIIQFLPGDLSRFKAAHSGVRVALSEQTSDVAVQEVSKGLADIAIFSATVDSNGLETFPYRRDRLVVIAPPEHPMAGSSQASFEEILGFEQVGLQPGSSLLEQLEVQAAQLNRPISFAVQVTSFDGVRRMVESGLGIAVLPEGAVVPDAGGNRLSVIRLSDSWAHRSLKLGVRETQALPIVARNMLAYLTTGEVPAPASRGNTP
jgi:DNA-binding transcriptional LysR family regulator